MTEETHAFVRYSIPELPYSHVEVPIDLTYIDAEGNDVARSDIQMAYRAVELLQYLKEQCEGAFAQKPQQPAQQPQQAQPAPQSAQPAPAPQNGAQRPQRQAVNYGNCPEHPNVQAVPSKAQYQEYDDVDGQQVPAKFFCPGKENGTGQNHSLWRSQLVFLSSQAEPAAGGPPDHFADAPPY